MSQKATVLIVDDEPFNIDVLQQELEELNYQIITAANGQEALDKIRSQQPDLILLDLMMPVLDGFAVLAEIKADNSLRDIPVIIVSMIDGRELGLALGAEDYFVKPVEREVLIRRLDELVPAAGAPVTLLLIDDDQLVHDMLDALLPPRGYRLEHAYSGADGLARVVCEPVPALVILDLMMTGMDGFEVAIQLKTDPRTASLPVLVLTSQELTPDEKEKLRGKIAGLMKKSEGISGRLASVVAELLRRHRGSQRAV